MSKGLLGRTPFAWGFLLTISLLAGPAWAQVTASVVGTVQDTSGAVISGVAVTVKNLETGAARTAATDDRGYYRALSLPVGHYEIAAEKTGFNTAVRTGIILVVGQEAVVNFSLEVGEVQQAITVSAEAPIVNTTTASTAGLVGEQQVKDLPLNGRGFDNLITLNPGTDSATAYKSGAAGQPQGNLFNVSGRRSVENLFLLNGIEYTGSSDFGTPPGGSSGQLLGIDAIREFNMQSHTYGAEYGKRSGGQIGIVTVSGTNRFHGTAFEFMRNSVLDARNFFDYPIGMRIPPFRRNDFGGSAGGPIRKDKTFIFGNYEGYRQSLTTTSVVFVPDANARQGLLPVGPGGALVNVGIRPGMAPYLAIYPLANGPVLGGGIAEAFTPALTPVREDFGTMRLDQVFSEKDLLTGAYTIDDGISTTPSADPYAGTTHVLRDQVLSLNESHTFSPNIINTLTVGFSRAFFSALTLPLIPLPPTTTLVEGAPMGQVTIGTGNTGAAGSLSSFGTAAQSEAQPRNLFTYTDSLQIVRGKHLITLGASLQRIQVRSNANLNPFGAVTFPSLQAFLLGQATALIGAPLNAPLQYSRQWEGAWYAKDTIQLRRNLTMALGLRHEFTNGWNVFPLEPVSYIFGPNGYAGGYLDEPLVATSVFTKNNAKWLFGPRIGLAWDPFGKGKTSIHAGFGTYYNLIDDVSFTLPGFPGAKYSLSNVQYPYVIPAGPVPAGALQTPAGVYPTAKTPTVQEWSLTIEQQLTASTGVSIGYVGSHGVHTLNNVDANLAQSRICSTSLGNCPAGLADGTTYFPAGSPLINPRLGTGSSEWWPLTNSSYQSLQIDVKQRFSKGLDFRANYSYSKSLDNASAVASAYYSNCPGYILNTLNAKMDYGPSCFDVTQRFVFSGSYELPIGAGKAFLGGLGGAADKLLSGWKLNGIVSAQTGVSFTPLAGFNVSRDRASTVVDRPDWNPSFSGPVIIGSVTKWFNPQAFVLPTAGTFGNAGRNILRGPPLSEVDMSLFKDTRLSEKLKLEFRGEFFNILNHANFAIPGTSLFTASGAVVGSAGVIGTTVTTSRQIQFGLKLIW